MYTKEGDRGITALARSKNVSKSDDRLVLIGTIDELVSQLGMIKALLHDEDTTGILDRIQRTLLLAAEGISDPYMREYRIGDEHTRMLETCIDRLQLPDKDSTRPLPGGSVLSAQIDLARAVCRRAERALSLVSVRYGADNGAKKIFKPAVGLSICISQKPGSCRCRGSRPVWITGWRGGYCPLSVPGSGTRSDRDDPGCRRQGNPGSVRTD